MRIYSMKATFGKLEHQTLTLTPGLNIIEAPNEWGKSTWCSFLICMLYGIDTRAKSSRQQLADKERFIPWSGAPMEGTIELSWQGRDITIQRSTKGRIPMGEFRAFETDTGLEVPELTAENCGQQLLGVEKDVFTRSAFLRFSDLPVTEDEQLRNRLNALVTTGDESGSGELLERKLKELKNRCRYNKTGLIPQLRQRKEQVEQQLQECNSLDAQTEKLQQQIRDTELRIKKLENHLASLRFNGVREQAELLQETKTYKEDAQRQLENLRDQAEVVPSRAVAIKNIRQLQQLQQDLKALQMEEQMLPAAPTKPEPPQGFQGCTAREAVMQAKKHRDELYSLWPKRNFVTPITAIIGTILLLFAVYLFFFGDFMRCIICAGVGLVILTVGLTSAAIARKRFSRFVRREAELSNLYHSKVPGEWVSNAEQYAQEWAAYANGETDVQAQLRQRKEELIAQSMILSRGRGVDSALDYWNDILSLWNDYGDARCNYRQADKNLQSLNTLVRDVAPPAEPDDLTFTEEETRRLISDAAQELRQLHARMGQYRGYADSLGAREALEQENHALEQRLFTLELTYAALELALSSLDQATAQLQRRFAPRIARTAQEILSRLTNGRYDRLTLSQDFSINVGATNEGILRSRHWRSDGTVDQLYLALRLAVARELIPEVPLVLDDAMVRFDNHRLRSALEILKQEADTKQVILFTCHGRERELAE